jgi:uncharacterized repeat protein (TIGR01451 family)
MLRWTGKRNDGARPSGHRRVGLLLGLGVVTIAVSALVFAGFAGAVGNIFELDGDATDASSGLPDDWSSITGAIDSTLVTDGTGTDDNTFTGGGTKDDLPISGWQWQTAKTTPEKNDIAHAYAAAYADNGELILFFGQDRTPDQAGDANVGFWFFQDDVSPNGSGGFNGAHQVNDIFVAAELTNGGGVPNIVVYKWNGSGLTKIADETSNAKCTGGTLSADVCGIANSGDVTVPGGGTVPSPYFFEGGMNVTKLLGGVTPCFGSFLANTRTSQSTNAVLKDFAGGQIDTCAAITINKRTAPGGGQGFQFSASGNGVSSFSLGDGGAMTFEKLNPGTYSVTETAPGAPWVFDSVEQCTGSGGSSVQQNAQNPAQIDITLTLGGSVECTYVNKRKPQVKLVKDFEGTATPIDLKLGDTVKGTFSGDGDTGFFTVDPGAYTASEVFQQGNGSLYTTTSKCVKNGSDPGFGDGLSRDFTVANGDEVVCTFKNVRKTVQITTVKDFVGTAAAVSIAAGPQSKSISGDDQVSATVEVGTTQVFSETLSDAQKAFYDTTVQCTGDQAPQAGVYSRQVAVTAQAVTCTFVNTHKQGSLEIKKDFVGTGAHQQVELRLDGVTKATLTADGTTGALTVDTGSYTASEVFSTAGDGDLYASTYSCTKNGQPYIASAAGRSVSVDVGKNDAVVCTLVNTRKTVDVTVEKDWVGSVTPVQLFVGTSTKNVSGEPAVHTVAVEAGSSTTVGETTVPANYDAFIRCGAESDTPYTGPKALSNVTAPVTCVVTNKEKPQVKLTKDLEPASDPGRFDLQIGGVTRSDDAGDGGTTGFVHVDPSASVTVGELAGNGSTDLSKYTSAVACDFGKGGAQGTSHTFPVTYGEKVSCVVTNTRNQGRVTVNKVWLPDSAKDSVTLKIGETTQSFGAGDTQSLSRSLNTGTVVNVGETAVPSGFDAFIDCTGDQAPEAGGSALDVTVGTEPITCTVTNKRKPRVKVTKLLSPSTDPGKFDLAVNGVTAKDDAGHNGTTGFVSVPVGSVEVGESAGTGTSLADYRSQVSCGAKGDGTAGATSHSFSVGYGDEVECTITNTRRTGTIEVVKVYATPDGQQAPAPYSSVALKVDGQTKATAPAQSTTGSVEVNTGLHSASEAFVQASDGDLYTSGGVCRLGDQVVGSVAGDGRSVTGVAVGDGDHVVCTFTNTRKARSIEVTKAVSEQVNGTFDTSASKPEPGGTFYFRVSVENTSQADVVTITGLEDLVDGIGGVSVDDLVCDIGDGGFPFELDPGESVVCTFTRDLIGEPRSETDHVDASWKDEEGQAQPDESSNDATVTITNASPAIGVDKVVTGASSLQVPGGTFSYKVTITNQSLVEDVTVTDLADFVDTDGALNGTGTHGAAITMNGLDCTVPLVIAKGGSKVCTFTATVSGGAGTYLDVIVVQGKDNENNATTADDDASVTLTATPPPPPPSPSSSPLIDVQVIKDATAQVQLGQDGKATITYTALVKNDGPNMANDVQLADPAPSGVVFGQITKQPDFGSCQLTSALLVCNLGTMGYGVQTLISWTATVSVTGTIVNTATTSGSGGADRVPANNVDDARTLVVSPVTPPKPKPKPKPTAKPKQQPDICRVLKVTPGLVKANGRQQLVLAKVTRSKTPVKGVAVRFSGSGLTKIVTTNARGVARLAVTPSKAGIVLVRITSAKACNTARIGVVGVFEPPVTG